MKLPRRIKLDIDQEYYNLIPAQQGDTARGLNFQILNNNIPFSLENKTVRARIKKPDGNVCYNDMEIINASEGECDLKLTNQILIKPGMCKVQLEIMENGEILSTIIFAIFIRESIDIKDAAESTNEFTALENGIIKLDEWDKYFKETSGAIEEKYTERLNGINSSLEDSIKYVTYEMFKPVCDGVSDDGVQIKACHEYANTHNLPVINKGGEYWIKDTRGIEVLTDTDLGNSIIHIDESFNNDIDVFILKGDEEKIEVSEESILNSILPKLKKGINLVECNELRNYRNSFCIFYDDTNVIYRSGSQPRPQQDVFYLDDNSVLNGEVSWDYTNLTKIEVKKISDKKINFIRGIFKLHGVGVGTSYVRNGIRISKSNAVIDEIYCSVDGDDVNTNASEGFIYFDEVYNVTLRNSNVEPRTYNGSVGTYGININKAIKVLLENVNSSNSSSNIEKWGVIGANLVKDLIVNRCSVNRVDTHFHAWNVSIINSNIGNKGILLTGGGVLNIQNTTVNNNYLVDFRSDYGSKWDGNIDICNSTLNVLDEASEVAILKFTGNTANFGDKYVMTFGNKIKLNNINVNCKTEPTVTMWIIRHSNQHDTTNKRILSNYIEARNITSNTEKGFKLLRVEKPNTFFTMKQQNSKSGLDIKYNALWMFDNIQLEKITTANAYNSGQPHLYINNNNNEFTENTLLPKILLNNCENIHINTSLSTVLLKFEDCKISCLDMTESSAYPTDSFVYFKNCFFKPILVNDTAQGAISTSDKNTFYENCVILPGEFDGVIDVEVSKTKYGLFDWSKNTARGRFKGCYFSDEFGVINETLKSALNFQ